VTSAPFRTVDRLARLALALLSLVVVASCGGGVSGPAPVDDPTRITILPAISTVYSGTPTTFVISGGTGSYIVASSNQTVLPVVGAITGNTLTVMPNLVVADTIVTLTVRDTGTTPVATATVTVKPGTVNNDITITPTASQGGSCAPAICSGGDAEVVATLSQGGSPLPARGTRFEVVSGNFFFITTPPGSSVETLATSVVVITDETGKARARIRVPADAPNQTALLQVTDLGTQAFRRASFVIVQATGSSPGFFVSPTSVTFQGTRTDQCAGSGISASFFIFGGNAPYTISNTAPTAFFVSPTTVSSSGGSFTVTPTGQCFDNAAIIVRDSSGRTVTVTASNTHGTAAVPPLTVSPDTVTLSSCTGTASVTASGGNGPPYFVSSGSDSVVASISGNTVTLSRRAGSAAPTGSVSVGVSDGTTGASITVNLSGTCPLVATPTSVTLTSCSAQTVAISGGSGSYSVASSSANVTASITGSTLTIRRTSPSLSFAPPATVTVTDINAPNATVDVTVGASGTGPGSGTGSCP
jgi:hypothetical protein